MSQSTLAREPAPWPILRDAVELSHCLPSWRERGEAGRGHKPTCWATHKYEIVRDYVRRGVCGAAAPNRVSVASHDTPRLTAHPIAKLRRPTHRETTVTERRGFRVCRSTGRGTLPRPSFSVAHSCLRPHTSGNVSAETPRHPVKESCDSLLPRTRSTVRLAARCIPATSAASCEGERRGAKSVKVGSPASGSRPSVHTESNPSTSTRDQRTPRHTSPE